MTMVSAVGFEPTTPGFIPLRLSSPVKKFPTVCGLDCPFTIGKNHKVLPVQSLHLPFVRAWLGIGNGLSHKAFPDFEQIRFKSFLERRPILFQESCALSC